jgi:hypothetical protein
MAVASVAQLLGAVTHPNPASTTVEPFPVPMECAAWLAAASTTPVDRSDPNGWYRRAPSVEAATRGVKVLSLAVSSLSLRERAETHTFTRLTLEPAEPNLRPFALPADRYTWAAPEPAGLASCLNAG